MPEVSPGVMAEISDAARALFAQMREDGVAAHSFDLHLDLQQLGIKIGANGSRSVEGHSLTVDLHVEAVQGTFQTESGEVSFQKLDVSFTMEETYVRATESAEKQDRQAGLIDGLKKLVSLLDRTKGNPGPEDGLGDLLMQIGRALETMARRVAKTEQGQLEGFELRETIELHMLSFQQTAVQSAQTEAA
jgi:hypothetical protein